MKSFFKQLIDQLPVLTGVDMITFLTHDEIDHVYAGEYGQQIGRAHV